MTIVTDNTSDRDGVDTLLNIETIRYADGDAGITTDIQNISAAKVFKLFPNPATEYLMLEWHTTNPIKTGNIRLYDQLGKTLKEIPFDTSFEKLRLDISNLPIGIYIIQLIGDKQSSSKKIIVK